MNHEQYHPQNRTKPIEKAHHVANHQMARGWLLVPKKIRRNVFVEYFSLRLHSVLIAIFGNFGDPSSSLDFLEKQRNPNQIVAFPGWSTTTDRP